MAPSPASLSLPKLRPGLPKQSTLSGRALAIPFRTGACKETRVTTGALPRGSSSAALLGFEVPPSVDLHGRNCTRDSRIQSPKTKGSKGRPSSLAATSAQDGAAASSSNEQNWTKVQTKKDLLLEYVNGVQPEFIERFFKKADDQVVDAMRQTVSNMLGTLPPQFFEVTVATVGENLAQLMFSVMMTGYMFRNAQYRMELAHLMGGAPLMGGAVRMALPEGPAGSNATDSCESRRDRYAEGAQTSHVSGDVLRWNKEDEAVERMPAAEYISMLEADVRRLQTQLDGSHTSWGEGHGYTERPNELLEFLRHLEPKNLEALTSSAEGDALEAMNVFIRRLLGVPDLHEIKSLKSRTSAAELARLLYWLLIVGYSLRSLEVRFDMEQSLLETSNPPKGLPPSDSSQL